MRRFLLLMHDDTTITEEVDHWTPYLDGLRLRNRLEGGSSIGGGAGLRKAGAPARSADHLVGYLIVRGADTEDVLDVVDGNPVYEAGGTVEICELIED